MENIPYLLSRWYSTITYYFNMEDVFVGLLGNKTITTILCRKTFGLMLPSRHVEHVSLLTTIFIEYTRKQI